MQAKLSENEIREFYHDNFVFDQVQSFMHLLGPTPIEGSVILDIGGGCGFFAAAIKKQRPIRVRVIDTDPHSVQVCRDKGIEADLSDALNPRPQGDETVICFNLILHHLVGRSEKATRSMQSKSLSIWRQLGRRVFIHEYIYEAYIFRNLSGQLIWAITSSRTLSFIGRLISKIVPSLRANTFGVGVRFRSSADWIKIFESSGFELIGYKKGEEERVSFARRLLLIKSCRRDSFLLAPAPLVGNV